MDSTKTKLLLSSMLLSALIAAIVLGLKAIEPKEAPVKTPVEQQQVIAPKQPPQKLVCVRYENVPQEQAAKVEKILSENHVKEYVSISQDNAFQIYWNLGKDEVLAKKQFEKQKKDSMKSERFILKQNIQKDWVVHITSLPNEKEAQQMVGELSEKASAINLEGKWEFVKPSSSFKIEHPEFLPSKVFSDIDFLLKDSKAECF